VKYITYYEDAESLPGWRTAVWELDKGANLVFFSTIVGVPTRGPGSQLVNAACFLVPDDDARGNTVTHRFILVLAAGPYVQQRGCARALYYLAPEVLVVGGTSEAREGEKLSSLC